MVIRRALLISATLFGTLLVGCASTSTPSPLPHGENILYINDMNNFAAVDIENGNMSIFKNDMFVTNVTYDSKRNRIVAAVDSDKQKYKGLLYLNEKEQKKVKVQDGWFLPVHIYHHDNYYVMDSARVLYEGKYTVTDTVIYNAETNEVVAKFPIPGVVWEIVGSDNKVYVSSNYGPKSPELQGEFKSNIYEIDLDTKKLRKVFSQDLETVPYELDVHNGFIYGVYQAPEHVAEGTTHDLLVKIDPKRGEIVKQLKLSTYPTDVLISSDGKYAFVSHFPNLAQLDLRIEKPLTRIDLATWEMQQASGDYRPISMNERNGKLYLGSDEKAELTVINEQTLQVEKRIPTGDILPIYVASEKRNASVLR